MFREDGDVGVIAFVGKEVMPVVALGELLYVNSARGRIFGQLSCWSCSLDAHLDAQRPSGCPCVAKSCVMLCSQQSASFQMVDFRVSQQLATQATEILQLFCRKEVIVGGRISGGSDAQTKDG